MFINIVFWLGSDRLSGLLSFVPGVLFSILMHDSLLAVFVCLFVLFHSCCSHCECLGKHSCLSSPFPIAILNGRSNMYCASWSLWIPFTIEFQRGYRNNDKTGERIIFLLRYQYFWLKFYILNLLQSGMI